MMIGKAILWSLGYCLIVALAVGLDYISAERDSGQKSTTITQTPTPNRPEISHGYTVIKMGCPQKDNCLIFAAVNENMFDCEKMKDLALQLKRDFAQDKNIRVLLFDNPTIPSEYVNGIRTPRDIDKDIRGIFEYDSAKKLGFIEFAAHQGGKFNEIRINLN